MQSAFPWVLIVTVVLVVPGCATRDLTGVWAYEDESSYFGISLDGDGDCRAVEAAKGGPGVGARCRYQVEGPTVTIFLTPHGDTPHLTLTYQEASDTMVAHGDMAVTLQRAFELVVQ